MTAQQSVTATLATIGDYIRWGASRFAAAGLCFGHGTANALDEAAALVLHAIHQPHDLATGFFACALTPEEREAVVALIERRVRERVPAAYLVGEAWFCGLPFYVDARVLVPRSPIAELIQQRFSPWLEDPDGVSDILDLCTGSGCIAITCALAFPQARVDAVDLSPAALEVARINVAKHEVEGQVYPLEGDLYAPVRDRRYDLIVSNPPYVNSAEWQGLPPEYHAEPRIGLESGGDGLDCVRRILKDAEPHLKPGGILVVEVGSSAEALEQAYPQVPFCWLDFERGGDGVFLLTAEQLVIYRNALG
ncbi:MAG: 50S ribosomal protein L3 N(5)-glutamine methyltransferase [Methylococcaceae bacterium]|nr:50S ribosomal protein L3 N(5)-glutamine methyltransferase [Methylococcaceae bacterium]